MAEKSASSKAKDGPRKCEACAITLPDIYAYADHLESKEHLKGIMKKKYGEKYLEAKANLLGKKTDKEIESDSDKRDSSDDEDQVYTCDVCKKVCTGILNYKLHLSGKNHEKKVKKARLLKQMKKDKLIDNDNSPTEENALVDGLQFASSDMLCKVCNKKCSGPEAFKQHNNSEAHKKKLAMQNLMKDIPYRKRSSGNHEIDSSDDDDEIVTCDVCCKEFSGPLPYRQHIESPAHLKQVKLSKKLAKLKDLVISSEDTNQIQCKECSKCFSGPKPFNDHLKSSLHSKLKQRKDLLSTLKEKHPEMIVQPDLIKDSDDSEDENTTIFCTVCHTAFTGPESARDHFQSQKHKKVLKEKIKYDKYKQLKNSKKANSKVESKIDEAKSDSSDGFDILG